MAQTTKLNFEEFLDLRLQQLKNDVLLRHIQDVSTARAEIEKQQNLLQYLDEETAGPKFLESPVNLEPDMNTGEFHDQEYNAGVAQEHNAGEPHSDIQGTVRDMAPEKLRAPTKHQTGQKDLQSPWRAWVEELVRQDEQSIKNVYQDMVQEFRHRHSRKSSKSFFGDHCFTNIIASFWFAVLSMLLICLNAAWIGYESDHVFDSEIGWHRTVNMIFCSAFLLELVLKIIALEKQFFLGPDYAWNLWDTFVVMSSIPELFGSSFNTTYLRLLRLAKLSRIFRMARLLKFFSSMHEILLTIFYTLGSLCWVLVALLLVSYCFALLMLQMIRSHLQEGGELSPDTTERFRSTWESLLTLFAFITGGLEWYDICTDFKQNQAYLAMYSLLFYIFFTLFGFYNVVTGVFCARANEASLECDELRASAEEKRYAKQVHEYLRLFRSIDVDNRGGISWTEFSRFAQSPGGMGMLQAYGLQLFDVDQIWQAMDSYDGDVDDIVDKPSFVMGIMRLSTEAMATSLFSLSVQVEKLQKDIGFHKSRTVAVSPPEEKSTFSVV